MTFLRHFVGNLPAQYGAPSTRPAHRVLFEFLRMAAIVALVPVISETVVPLADTFRSPERRLIFVVWWAAFMAAWNLWSGRRAARGGI